MLRCSTSLGGCICNLLIKVCEYDVCGDSYRHLFPMPSIFLLSIASWQYILHYIYFLSFLWWANHSLICIYTPLNCSEPLRFPWQILREIKILKKIVMRTSFSWKRLYFFVIYSFPYILECTCKWCSIIYRVCAWNMRIRCWFMPFDYIFHLHGTCL
jgi:hypothetical protein